MNKKICFWSLLVVSMVSFAKPSPAKWECVSFDHLNRSYPGSASSARGGMAAARQACINNSKLSSRCRVSHNWCQRDAAPIVYASCVAEDDSGKRFEASGNDACETALNQCEGWQEKLSVSKRQHCAIIHR